MGDHVEVRQVEVDELTAYNTAKVITFLEAPTDSPAWRQWRSDTYIPGRSWCGADGADIVATLRTMPRELSVPDGSGGTRNLSVDALTGVTVAATHRRRGLLRRMLTESLAAAHERGDAVSILIAAQWPIYGRFGYSPASTWVSGHLETRGRGARLRVSSGGHLRRIDPAVAGPIGAEVFAAARVERAGQIDRPSAYWDRVVIPELQPPGQAPAVTIVHEGPDGIDGYLRWHPTETFELNRGGSVAVDDLFGAGQDAYNALWGYLLGLDVVDRITFAERPPDEPLPHLLEDGRSWQVDEVVDGVWLRLLDVPAALSSRGYAVAGRLVLEVIDDAVGGYAAGRFALDAGPDGVTCRRAPELSPDLTLSQRALASVYLGQPSLRLMQIAGMVDEHRAGAVQRLDVMFATALSPWLATEF